jgi:hypothetical protein
LIEPITKLTPQEITLVENAKADLQFAEQSTGVDWRLLAGILYRENSLRVTIPGRVGGVWQFDDSTLNSARKKALLDKYSNLSAQDKNHIIAGGWSEFKWGSILAGCFIRDKVTQVLDVRESGDLPDDSIGNALYAYNGRAYGLDWKNSPYVYNNGDVSHMGLYLKGSMPKVGAQGREVTKYKDTRLGSFVVYKQLQILYPRVKK